MNCSAPSGVELAEAQDIVGLLAELPDLWDVNLAAWYNDSVPSRFAAEGAQEPFIDCVKKITSKPVVGVGRFTSPDTMVSQIRRGVLDMIGAARPSIADPFLPAQDRGRAVDDIRECIGCNICVSGDMTIVADPLHAEPDHGRGMAQGLAPGAHPAPSHAEPRAGGRWRTRGPRGGARPRPARLRGQPRRGTP